MLRTKQLNLHRRYNTLKHSVLIRLWALVGYALQVLDGENVTRTIPLLLNYDRVLVEEVADENLVTDWSSFHQQT